MKLDPETTSRVSAVCWFVAGGCVLIMIAGVHIPWGGPMAAGLLAAMASVGLVALVGCDIYLGYRIWRDPPDWAAAAAAWLLGATAILAAAILILGHVPQQDVNVSVPLVQPAIGVLGAIVAAAVTIGPGPLPSMTPKHRCPHCGAILSWRSWRSCEHCGLLLSSSRYRH